MKNETTVKRWKCGQCTYGPILPEWRVCPVCATRMTREGYLHRTIDRLQDLIRSEAEAMNAEDDREKSAAFQQRCNALQSLYGDLCYLLVNPDK